MGNKSKSITIHKPGAGLQEVINANYGIDFHLGDDTINVRFDAVTDTLVITKDYETLNIHLTGSVNKVEVS